MNEENRNENLHEQGIPQEQTQSKPTRNLFSLILKILIALLFVGITVYMAIICVEAFANDGWAKVGYLAILITYCAIFYGASLIMSIVGLIVENANVKKGKADAKSPKFFKLGIALSLVAYVFWWIMMLFMIL